MRNDYRAARLLFTLISLAGYICIAGAVIIPFQSGAETPVLTIVVMLVAGLILLAAAQLGTATIDTARNTAALLEVMQRHSVPQQPAPQTPIYKREAPDYVAPEGHIVRR